MLFALAANIHNPLIPSTGQTPDTAVSFLEGGVNAVLTFLFTAAFILFAVMLLWGGIEYILSGGDKEKATVAKARLTHALMGIGFTLLVFAIINLVGYLFGVDLLKLRIPQLYTSSITE